MQHRNHQADSPCDLETIIEEDFNDESYSELVPVNVSKPLESTLSPEASPFQPPNEDLLTTAEDPKAGCDSMEKPVQTDAQQEHSDPSTVVIDQTHDTIDSA